MDPAAFTISATVPSPYDATVARVRTLLADAGFGVLTEIDIRATLKAKLDEDVPAQLILGACRPQLAHRALQAEPRVAALMPCNVVVADAGEGRTRVDVMDPGLLATLAPRPELAEVAADARARLTGMMESLTADKERVDEAGA
ncbi:DUF302 domain-containing protein [Pimelobacter simplex]|uniref:DUF302 domain-containing protein n=1 Tax=Nocardioides simplex TaxID=2045 RepID=UPI0021500D89|nr:DUF302 domain-containing protein [Pimelobacter simplex]UUW87266.1 DUF302 domain-containing protein [Pimelobacter simplex]UUW96772.1 DUF302 domain-containing protein [Pimelobacter simplex]